MLFENEKFYSPEMERFFERLGFVPNSYSIIGTIDDRELIALEIKKSGRLIAPKEIFTGIAEPFDI
jgi:hypothetical protein